MFAYWTNDGLLISSVPKQLFAFGMSRQSQTRFLKETIES